MRKPKACIYDNPRTMRREAWRDGRLVAHVSANLTSCDGFDGWPEDAPVILNCGPWQPDRARGTRVAMGEEDYEEGDDVVQD